MEKKRATAAHMRATAKYERENYDKALIRFPRGTLDEIRSTGDSINGFTVRAVAEKLAAIRARLDADGVTLDSLQPPIDD